MTTSSWTSFRGERGRGELLSSVERRRRGSAREKAAVALASRAPGAGVADVARRFEVRRQQVYDWRSAARWGEFAGLEASAGFVKVIAAPAPAADSDVDDEAVADAATPEECLPPRRRGAPRTAPDAPRESIVLDPGERCPDCGGTLRLVGEDVAEILDLIAAKLKVVEVHRPKKSCRDCERMVQTPSPPRPIPRGMAGPALLAVRHRARTDGATMAHPGGEVRRPPPPVSTGRDLRPHGRRHPALDADRLVRPGRGRAPPVGRRPVEAIKRTDPASSCSPSAG
jgi:transposase/transposase-like protein